MMNEIARLGLPMPDTISDQTLQAAGKSYGISLGGNSAAAAASTGPVPRSSNAVRQRAETIRDLPAESYSLLE